MNRNSLDELNSRLSRMETILAWLLAAAWLLTAIMAGLVLWAVLA
jgi:membrane protein YdbS with pleckstrin-like domain